MQYEGNIIRPPSEANSIILQVTTGCSHNACSFCGAYTDKKFRIKEKSVILADIQFAATYCQRQKTVFLADGNALAVPQKKLLHLLRVIRRELPWVRRISLYANCLDILGRSVDDLDQLRELGLGRIYMGLESGHDQTLKQIHKSADADKMIAAGKKVRAAGIFLSVTVLLGIGGMEYSREHATATARVLSEMKPSQIAVLTLMVLAGTPLGKRQKEGQFILPDQKTLFTELLTIVTNLSSFKTQFQANHASNYFSLDGRLPRDRNTFISYIQQAIDGYLDLKSEKSRAL